MSEFLPDPPDKFPRFPFQSRSHNESVKFYAHMRVSIGECSIICCSTVFAFGSVFMLVPGKTFAALLIIMVSRVSVLVSSAVLKGSVLIVRGGLNPGCSWIFCQIS